MKKNALSCFSKRLLLIVVGILSFTVIYAQNITVTGIVTDSNDEPLIGVSIRVQGTSQGSVTDINGKFSISNVPPNAKLEVSYVGMQTQVVEINGRSSINVILKEETEALEEVVVVGYGMQKKASLTGAVSAVTNKEIVSTKNENLQNMLAGKIAGLRIAQNSSEPGQYNTYMDIRGFGSPLVVIDGVPRNNISRLNPEDIENISVIKDASGAVYGSRAANGVIIITTKKGDKTGLPNINYSGYMSWQKPSNYPDLVDAADWMMLYNEKLKHNVDNSNVVPRYSAEEIESYRNGTNLSTNWEKAVMRTTAPATQHIISATGGNNIISYFTSIGYLNQGSFLNPHCRVCVR